MDQTNTPALPIVIQNLVGALDEGLSDRVREITIVVPQDEARFAVAWLKARAAVVPWRFATECISALLLGGAGVACVAGARMSQGNLYADPNLLDFAGITSGVTAIFLGCLMRLRLWLVMRR